MLRSRTVPGHVDEIAVLVEVGTCVSGDIGMLGDAMVRVASLGVEAYNVDSPDGIRSTSTIGINVREFGVTISRDSIIISHGSVVRL